MISAIHKNTLESHVVSYLDKMDAYCEATHEFYSGNITAIQPYLGYERALATIVFKHPKLAPLLEYKKSPWTFYTNRTDPMTVRRKYYNHLFKPHTKASIKKETDFPVYDRWKKITLENFKDGEKMLTIPSH